MARESIAGLIAQLYSTKIDRREFGKRAAAAGLSVGLIGQVLNVHATRAQDAMPESTQIGNPDVGHTTDTSKGTIKIYSSWPFTGSMERVGGHAIEAATMGFEDFGMAAGGYAIEFEALDEGVAANNGGWEAGKATENVNKAINDELRWSTWPLQLWFSRISIPITNRQGWDDLIRQHLPGTDQRSSRAQRKKASPISTTRPALATTARLPGRRCSRWCCGPLGIQIRTDGTKAYVLHDNSLYGKGVAQVFANTFAETAAKCWVSRAMTAKPRIIRH